jgi:hypothetical protein
LRWPRNTLYLQRLTLTSPTSGGRSVGIVCLRATATELVFFLIFSRMRPARHSLATSGLTDCLLRIVFALLDVLPRDVSSFLLGRGRARESEVSPPSARLACGTMQPTTALDLFRSCLFQSYSFFCWEGLWWYSERLSREHSTRRYSCLILS